MPKSSTKKPETFWDLSEEQKCAAWLAFGCYCGIITSKDLPSKYYKGITKHGLFECLGKFDEGFEVIAYTLPEFIKTGSHKKYQLSDWGHTLVRERFYHHEPEEQWLGDVRIVSEDESVN